MSNYNPQLPSLSPAVLNGLFPFHLCWNRELRLVGIGSAIHETFPDVRIGSLLTEEFQFPQGGIVHHDFEALGGLGPATVLLRNRSNSMELRGVIVPMDANKEDPRQAFIGAPIEGTSHDGDDLRRDPMVVGLLGLLQVERDMAAHIDMQANSRLQHHARLEEYNNQLLVRLTKLLESEERLERRVFEMEPLAMAAELSSNSACLTDAQGRITWVNEAFTQLTGWRLDEIRGQYPGAFLRGPGTNPQTIAYMEKQLQAGQPYEVELLNYTKDGRKHWVELSVKPIFGPDGKVTHFMSMSRDTTQVRREIQRRNLAIAASQILNEVSSISQACHRVLQVVIEQMEWDAATVWLLESPAGDCLVCRAYAQARGLDLGAFATQVQKLEFLPGQGVPGLVFQSAKSIWISNLTTDPRLCREMKTAGVDAGLRQAFALPIRIAERVIGVIYLFAREMDEPDDVLRLGYIGVANQMAQFLKRRQVETDLVQAKESAEAANRSKDMFLATISHEIRTPMNGILGMASILADSSLTQGQAGMLDSIRASGDALMHIIDDILDFSKIEALKLQIENVAFAVLPVLEDAIDLFAANAQSKGLEFALVLGRDFPRSIHSDPMRLRQVLLNLVGNAIKFTSAGRIVIRADGEQTPTGACLRVDVSDTGVGIPDSARGRLLMPFEQVDASTTRRYGGTGLGLAICKRVLDMMGGRIVIDSKVDEGSTFTFWIPLGQTDMEPLPPPPESIRGLRCLIVDDHAADADAIASLMHGFGHPPVVVPGGTNVPELLARERFDVVIADRASCSEAKASAWATLPEDRRSHVVISQALVNVIVAAPEYMSSFRHITKPVKREQLFRLLQSLVGPAAAPMPPAESHSGAESPRPIEGRKVLLVEDNELNSRLALLILQKLGASGIVAANGIEALLRLGEADFDAIVMDCHMPYMDGHAATRIIRGIEAYPAWRRSRIPIIAMTANAMAGERDACIECGMDDYLTKPVNIEQLTAKLDHWIRAERTAWTGGDASIVEALKRLSSELEASMARELFAGYLADVPVQVEALRVLAAKGPSSELVRAVHSLKGISATFGIDAIVARCAVMEACAGHAEALSAQLLQFHESVRKCFEELLPRLEALRDSLHPGSA